MILKIPCHWVLWLKFIAVITDIMACWVARYYRPRSEGKKELVRGDYKIVSDWDSWSGVLDQTFRDHNYKPITITSPARRQFYYESARPPMSLFKVKDINIENTLFIEQMAPVNTEARGRGRLRKISSILSSLSHSLPLSCLGYVIIEFPRRKV